MLGRPAIVSIAAGPCFASHADLRLLDVHLALDEVVEVNQVVPGAVLGWHGEVIADGLAGYAALPPLSPVLDRLGEAGAEGGDQPEHHRVHGVGQHDALGLQSPDVGGEPWHAGVGERDDADFQFLRNLGVLHPRHGPSEVERQGVGQQRHKQLPTVRPKPSPIGHAKGCGYRSD